MITSLGPTSPFDIKRPDQSNKKFEPGPFSSMCIIWCRELFSWWLHCVPIRFITHDKFSGTWTNWIWIHANWRFKSDPEVLILSRTSTSPGPQGKWIRFWHWQRDYPAELADTRRHQLFRKQIREIWIHRRIELLQSSGPVSSKSS